MAGIEGTVAQAATLAPARDTDAILGAGLPRRGRKLADLLIVGGWALPALDLLTLGLAYACAILITKEHSPRLAGTVFPLFGMLAMAARGAYGLRLRLIVLDSVGVAVGSISVAAMGALALGLFVDSSHPGTGLLFRAWLLGVAYVGIVRISFTLWQQRRRVAGVAARRTIIVGAGEVGARIGRRLDQSPAYGLLPIGYLDNAPPADTDVGGRPAPVLGAASDLVTVVREHDIDHVILAFSNTSDGEVLPLLRKCAAQGIGVSLVPRLFDLINSRLIYEPVGGLPVATLHATNPLGPTFALKHAIDRVVAVLALILLAPLMALIAFLVKHSSPGPVLFRQRRIGRDNRPFDVLKFRTMTSAPEEAEYRPATGLAPGGVEGTDRRTRLGRWLRRTSLDELPQLLNVARGEMSLVGPRPERPEYAEQFAADLARYAERHRVRAGITGLSQVHGLRGQSSIADRVELDNYYIENWSLGLDLKILLLTVVAVLKPAE